MIISTTITNSRETVIGKALEAIQTEVDACIVIDTGANDGTLEAICQVVHPDKLHIFGFVWQDDFAAARNYALFRAHAIAAGAVWRNASVGCWAITADTDEVLCIPGAKQRLAECSDDIVMVEHSSGSYVQPRCIRLGSNVEWFDPVHEFLGGVQTSRQPFPDWHFTCQPRPEEDATLKYERYLAIQQSLEPNQRRLYYLADTLAILGRIPEAIDCFLRAGRTPGWSEQGAWAYMRAAILQHRRGELDAALQSCMGGIVLAPHVGELYVLGGSICMTRGDYGSAKALATVAVRVQNEARGGFSWPELRFKGANRLLSMAVQALNGTSQIQ